METVVRGSGIYQLVLATGRSLVGATKLEMHATKPNGQSKVWSATEYTTPMSIVCSIPAGDLDVDGIWRIASYAEWGDSVYESADPFELNVVAPGTDLITTTEIRNAINIPEAKELSEDVITSAINRAGSYISVLQATYSAPATVFPATRLAYAIYLAYQAYADRVLNVPPGSYQQGQWTPIQEEISRDTSAKLRGLRETYEDFEKIVKFYPRRPMGRMFAGTRDKTFTFGQYNYENRTTTDLGSY